MRPLIAKVVLGERRLLLGVAVAVFGGENTNQ
jgi:hypothetical protein